MKFTPEPGGSVTLIPGKGVTRVQMRVQGAVKIEHSKPEKNYGQVRQFGVS